MRIKRTEFQIKKVTKLVSTWRNRIYLSGLTQEKFCASIGLCRTQLSPWIKFKHLPCPRNIELVENALKELGV